MKKLALIPARGGSKRIPRKNIRAFLGKPILSYSIRAALDSGLFDEVMVSTDDREIADIAEESGAKVPFLRSEETANDFATTAAVVKEVLQEYGSRGVHFDYCCCIYPTAPLIRESHLHSGFELVSSSAFNRAIPVVAFGYPVWRGFRRNEEGSTTMIWPENRDARSQDLEKVYHDAGQWYWIETGSFMTDARLFTEKTGSVILDETEVQDIDTLTDWTLAEIKYQLIHGQ